MTKKIFGYTFIVISFFLVLGIPFLLPELLKSGFRAIAFFNGEAKIAEAGKAFGFIIFWMIHVSLTATLWRIGRKWTKQSKKELKTIGDLFDSRT